MAIKIKIPHEKDCADTKPFKFSDSFLDSFKNISDVYDTSLKELDNAIYNDSAKFAYGICNCTYKLRYITPNDISTYISCLSKGLNSCMFTTLADIHMFTTASIKRCMEDNDCLSFESTEDITTGGGNNFGGKYVNPKEYTMSDLINMCKDDYINTMICSRYEVAERAKNVKEIADMFKKMRFGITLKNIVDTFPVLIKQSESLKMLLSNPNCKEVFTTFVESFIIFAFSLNIITIKSIMDYCKPSTTYDVIPENDNSKKLITECCLLKTNDMCIRNKIPFNCNMRDVVLQDVHPRFNDTKSALQFILNDARSPISILINKYSKCEGCTCPIDSEYIYRMFIGHTKFSDKDKMTAGLWTDKKGHSTENPYDKYCVHTNVEWLDKIAYGNNYLDGNYRDDAVGNEHVNPITKTLDTIYKMFGGCELTSNSDLADNLKQVASMMLCIIDAYPEEGIENWDLVKDILAVFGEIFTRNMLKLYYNNTRVFVFDDKSEDTMVPGYLYTESYYMEADDKTATTVSFKNPDGSDIAGGSSAKLAIGNANRRFTDWVRNTLSKFFTKFNENHKMEIDYISKNDEMNKNIATAITNGSFVPVVSNFPKFKVPAGELSRVNISNIVTKYMSSKNAIDEKSVLKEMLPTGIGDAAISTMVNDENTAKEYITNYILYSTTNKPDSYTGKLTVDLWNDLLDNIKGSPKLIETESKAISDDLAKACEMLNSKINKTANNSQTKDANANATAETDNAQTLLTIVQKISRIYQTNMLNTFNSKLFGSCYKIYRDIVAGYKQQGSPVKQATPAPAQQQQPATSNTNSNNTQANKEDISVPV